MHVEIVRQLRCPLCGGTLAESGGGLRCERGHGFDVARQGYVNLLARAPQRTDTPEMVAARSALFEAGHFDPVLEAVADAAPPAPGLVVDVGAGPGHYLARVLAGRPDAVGLALDVSKAAARRAARAHPRAGAAVCDIWRGIPLADAAAGTVLNVFAPRNAAEFARILRPDGTLVVVTPRPDHLQELVRALGLLTVDPEKEQRLSAALAPWFRLNGRRSYAYERTLSPPEVANLVAMGPSAWHTTAPPPVEPLTVTIAVDVRALTPRS